VIEPLSRSTCSNRSKAAFGACAIAGATIPSHAATPKPTARPSQPLVPSLTPPPFRAAHQPVERAHVTTLRRLNFV
jgi:hypothetical protein